MDVTVAKEAIVIEEDKIGSGMAEVHVRLTTLVRNLPRVEALSGDDLHRAKLEVRAQIHEIEQLIIRAEEDIVPYEAAQRDFNMQGWWYRFNNSHIMRVPVAQWRRQLAAHKETIAEMKPKYSLNE